MSAGREVNGATDLQHKIVPRTAPIERGRGVHKQRAAATNARGSCTSPERWPGIPSVAVSAPVRDAADPLGYGAQHTGTVVTAALLVLVVGLSLGFIPVVLFPVLRRAEG